MRTSPWPDDNVWELTWQVPSGALFVNKEGNLPLNPIQAPIHVTIKGNRKSPGSHWVLLLAKNGHIIHMVQPNPKKTNCLGMLRRMGAHRARHAVCFHVSSLRLPWDLQRRHSICKFPGSWSMLIMSFLAYHFYHRTQRSQPVSLTTCQLIPSGQDQPLLQHPWHPPTCLRAQTELRCASSHNMILVRHSPAVVK